MRVSVVATGIDAVSSRAEAPLPRRSMAAPLVAAQPAPKPAAQPIAQPAARPAAAAMAAARSQVVQSNPVQENLFEDEMDMTAAEQAEDIFEEFEPEMAEDDLPPPAYTPRAEPPMDRAPDAFVAPRAPAKRECRRSRPVHGRPDQVGRR